MKPLVNIDSEKITSHVYSRCINGSSFLENSWYKNMLIDIFCYAKKKIPFELHALTILDNHFHALITTANDAKILPDIMFKIKKKFTVNYNKSNNRIGTLWNERYGRKYVETADNPETYLLSLLWYLAFNPIRKNYTDVPGKYKFDSINYYLINNYHDNMPISMHNYYLSLSKNPEERIKIFKEYGEKYKYLFLDSKWHDGVLDFY
ncbi:MAG: transposase [Spirochaetes bacterium]|nr:transposase [Spirochaetota bacterium]